MPKLKTHKSTAKRIKTTASGKLLRRRAFGNHKLSGKSASRKRVIGSAKQVTGNARKNLKRALGA